MGNLWLYAMPLEDVRAFFSAPADLADELLAQAGAVIKAPTNNLLGRVGPLFRHPVVPVIDLPMPSADDAQNLVEGRSIAPERLAPAWTIVRHWCDVRAAGRLSLEISQQQLSTIDFHIVSGGLSSQFSLETIVGRDPHLPLRTLHGSQVGWMPAAHAALAAEQWPTALADGRLPDDVIGLAEQLCGFFCQVPDWSANGQSADVLALLQ